MIDSITKVKITALGKTEPTDALCSAMSVLMKRTAMPAYTEEKRIITSVIAISRSDKGT
jgi:hypothetical protein